MQSFQMIEEYWLGVVRKNCKENCKIIVFANKSEGRDGLSREEIEWCEKEDLVCY